MWARQQFLPTLILLVILAVLIPVVFGAGSIKVYPYTSYVDNEGSVTFPQTNLGIVYVFNAAYVSLNLIQFDLTSTLSQNPNSAVNMTITPNQSMEISIIDSTEHLYVTKGTVASSQWFVGNSTLVVYSVASAQWVYISGTPPTVTQPIKVTMDNSAPSATVTVNGCSPTPSTFASDGLVHNVTLNLSCSFYLSFSNSGNGRDGFNIGGTFEANSANVTSSASELDLTGYLQYSNQFAYSVTGGGTPTAPVITYTYLGIGGNQTTLTASLSTIWMDYNSACSVTNPTTGSTGTERWDTQSACPAASSGGGSTTFAYYHQYSPTYQITANAQSTFDNAMTLQLTGTQFGSGSANICLITTTVAATDSCTGWEDSGTPITFPAILTGAPSNSMWANVAGSSSSVTISSTALVNVKYYKQLNNTYQATPSNPVTWDGIFTVTITGTSLGSGSFTICSMVTSNGGGSVSCSGYADYNTQVSLPASLNSAEWTEQGTYQFTDTTGGNMDTVQYQTTIGPTGGCCSPPPVNYVSSTTSLLNYTYAAPTQSTPNFNPRFTYPNITLPPGFQIPNAISQFLNSVSGLWSSLSQAFAQDSNSLTQFLNSLSALVSNGTQGFTTAMAFATQFLNWLSSLIATGTQTLQQLQARCSSSPLTCLTATWFIAPNWIWIAIAALFFLISRRKS